MVTSTLLVIAAGIVAWAVLVLALQRHVLYPRPPVPPTPAGDRATDIERLWIGPKGRVEAWLLQPRTAASGPAPGLLFFHGNGELIDHWLEAFETPRSWGMTVLLVEYPGYGRSGGRPSQRSITTTACDAWDELAARSDVDPRRMVAYGRSLGGAAACALARERTPAALVLESTFTSVTDLARRMGVPAPLVLDPFDNRSALAGFGGEVLIVHGRDDPIIPYRHAEELHRLAPGSQLETLPCGHNDCPRPWRLIHDFLVRHRILRPEDEEGPAARSGRRTDVDAGVTSRE